MRGGPSALVVALLGAASAGCVPVPPTITPVPTVGSASEAKLSPSEAPLQVELANTELALGEERLAFQLRDGSGRVLRGSDVEVRAELLAVRADGSRASVAQGPAFYFGSKLTSGGAWIAYTEFDSSGEWILHVTASRPDGWQAAGEAVLVVGGRTDLPRIGSRPPTEEPAQLASGQPATSDPDPDPDLYRLSVAEALESGLPSVIYLGSPGHCSSPACRETLAEIKAVKPEFQGRVNFLHLETRDVADPSQWSPVALAWHLPSEPWTFIVDAGGRIVNRVEGPLDRVELKLLLNRLLGQ